jgi:hypothetical protein
LHAWTAARKGYPLAWSLTWLWISLFLAAMIGIATFANDLRDVFHPFDLGTVRIAGGCCACLPSRDVCAEAIANCRDAEAGNLQ